MRHPVRALFAVLAVAVTLGWLAGDADARVGGGSSSGSRGSSRTFSAPPTTHTAPNAAQPMQRSVTQPGQPGSTIGAARPATGGSWFNRPGLLGGLAAGFLGAGLFGMLFGHGMFGGLGGLASMLGLIVQVGLIALVAMLIWRWFQRRNQPAMASGPALHDYGGMSQNYSAGPAAAALNGGGYGGGSAQPSDAIGISGADYDAFEKLLIDSQAAYSNEDLSALRSLATPEMVSYFADDLANNSSRGIVNRISDVKLLQGDLAEAWREDGADYATVAMRIGLNDQMIERASGRTVEGGAQEVTEVWTFRRSPGGRWQLSAIQQT
jgi:predicted lipid-binding transport protein (Tim44 family)